MNEIIGMGFLGAFITAIISIVFLIVFFIMASNVGQIKRTLRTTYRCKHCGFKSKSHFDFCPVCDKNGKGHTLKELREKVKLEQSEN